MTPSLSAAPTPLKSATWSRPKYLLFALFSLMAAYVLYNNERFIVDPQHPDWDHYLPFKWWLLAHGLAGGAALLIAPMQFSDRIRRNHTALHRIAGRVYVAGAVVAGLTGIYIQYFQERLGLPRSFTMAATTHGTLWMVTTGVALFMILKGKVQQHRQWMTRSIVVGPVVFLATRVVLGLTGWGALGPAAIETTVWVCVACAIPLADIILQVEEQLRARQPAAGRTKT